jgi:predicted 3-demethylubiquinone-9 3-methyltransferase (glyoxalase superfamily)
VEISRYAEAVPGKEGSIEKAEYQIAGKRIICIDSPVNHAFNFTPSISLFVDRISESQFDGLHKALSKDGFEPMPLGNFGFSRTFARVLDRFGVSWQINLPAEEP